MDAKNKRSIIFLGHAQSGKTTLAEAILYFCKATTRKGSVNDGTTVSDYSFDEIERKSSISSGFLYCEHKGCRIQMLDAPGYADFFGEVIAGARAVDAALIVVDASAGVEVGTERAWQILEEANVPCFIFINKIDKEDVDVDKVVSDLKDQLSKKAMLINSLEDPDLIESIAESDDKLIEKYLEGAKLSLEELKSGLRQAVMKRNVFPVTTGSGLTAKGLSELLDAIVEYSPNPLEHAQLEVASAEKPDEKKAIEIKQDGPFIAFVFKSISDPYVGQLSLLRVFSGSLAANTSFYNVNKKTKERIGSIYLLQGKEQRGTESASCGDIVAIAKLKETVTSDSLSDGQDVVFDPIIFPEPAISASVKPKTRQDD